jgi:hypothetical protein
MLKSSPKRVDVGSRCSAALVLGMLSIDDHPLLDLTWTRQSWPSGLGSVATDSVLSHDFASPPADLAPLTEGAAAVRDLLRWGGFKPSGRSKPCSEYIAAVYARGDFPRINAAVDLTNLAVLHGGLPVSTVDLDRVEGPLRVAIAPPGSSYVFNASGQTIDLGGLLCLFDAQGPCANAVKDAQRAKTTPETRRTLTVVWGTRALPGRAAEVLRYVIARARSLGAEET